MSRSTVTNRLTYLDAPIGSWNVDPLSSTVRDQLMKLPPSMKFYVDDSIVGRADLISYQRYGTVDLWWLVLEYNGVLHNLDLIATLPLQLPAQDQVMSVLNKARSVSIRFGDSIDFNRKISQRRIVVA